MDEQRTKGDQGGDRPALVAVPGDDLAQAIARQAADIDRSGVWIGLRALLVMVATGYLLLAVPELLFSNDLHHAHLSQHLGAFGIAYGVGLLFVAMRPATAKAFVPFTVALAVGMTLVAVVAVARGEQSSVAEAPHLLELAGLTLVWMLATRRGWRR